MNPKGGATLRERQTAATREAILDVAMEMLGNGADHGFSHEAIAQATGMGARTVYRHFPDRALLLEALWVRLREATNTRFPAQEEEIVASARALFREFDEHEALIRASLVSSAGSEVRDRGGAEGRPAFAESLKRHFAGLGAAECARVVAVFVAVYSAPFWQLLRDRGGLSGPQAQEAVAWCLGVLLDGLGKPDNLKEKRGGTDGETKREEPKIRRAGR